MTLRLGRVSENTIRNALLYMRAEILRDGLDGLEHVDALLAMRGHDPVSVPRKVPKTFKRNELRRMILEELRSGPMTGRELADRIAARAGRIDRESAYKRVYTAFPSMQHAGIIEKIGHKWGIVNLDSTTHACSGIKKVERYL